MARTTSPPASPLLYRLHLGLTGLLLAALLTLAGLAAAGRVHLGRAAEADRHGGKSPRRKAEEKDRDAARPAGKDGGRYRIEAVDDIRHVVGEAGKLGVFGEPVREAWVFRYQGGLLECKLETDYAGQAVSSGMVPDNWPRFLAPDDALRQGKPEALRKEGYIVVLGMTSVLSVEDALKPLYPHLGALFTAGPAGPLHALVPYYHEVWPKREYRLFLCAGPPRGETGHAFNLWVADQFLVRTFPVGGEDPSREPAQVGGGTDLEPGKEHLLLERSRGKTSIRLKARFLSDAEVLEKVKQ